MTDSDGDQMYYQILSANSSWELANGTGSIQMGMRTKVPGKILWPHDQQ